MWKTVLIAFLNLRSFRWHKEKEDLLKGYEVAHKIPWGLEHFVHSHPPRNNSSNQAVNWQSESDTVAVLEDQALKLAELPPRGPWACITAPWNLYQTRLLAFSASPAISYWFKSVQLMGGVQAKCPCPSCKSLEKWASRIFCFSGGSSTSRKSH